MSTKLQTELRKMIDGGEHMRPEQERHLGSNVYGRYVIDNDQHAILIYCKWESICTASDAISAVNNTKRVLADLHGGTWGAKHHGFQRGAVGYGDQQVNVNGYRVTWWAEEAAGVQASLIAP